MYKAAEGFTTTLAAPLVPSDMSLQLGASAIAYLVGLGIDGTNYTEVAISDGFSFEIVRLNNIAGYNASITRAQSGTVASSFPTGSSVRFVWTANGIQEEAAAVGAAVTITSNVPGAVTGGPANFNIQLPVFTAGPSLQLTGVYPNYTIDIDPLAKDEFEQAGSGTVTVVKSSPDFTVSDANTEPNIALTSIFPTGTGGNTFGAGMGNAGYVTGIRVSNTGRLMEVVASSLPNGIYSNATVTVVNGVITGVANGSAPGAGLGTVTVVNAGTGITVSGVPTNNPTIGLSSTGVAAGTYEGFQVNAQGQIVAVPAGFGPISSITTTTNGVTIASGGVGIRTINIASATDTAQGLTEYADNAEATNFTTNNRALTPASLKVALNSLGSLVSEKYSVGTIASPAVTHSIQSQVVGAADALYIVANVVFSDPTAGPDEYNQSFAVGLYVNGSLVAGLPAFKSGHKTITHIVTNFLGGVIELRCTALTGSQTASGTMQILAIGDVP